MSLESSTWALIPVRSFRGAKERLGAILSPAAREELVRAMLQDMLKALQASKALTGVAVTSPDETVLDEADRLGALALKEPPGAGLNGSLDLSRSTLVGRGATALLVLPGDVPQLEPVDVEALLAVLPQMGAVLVEADDGGTTALLLRPPLGLPFCFGPNSARAHREAAATLGLACRDLHPASLAWDIDRPEDLDRLVSCRTATFSRRALTRLGIASGDAQRP